MYKNWEKVIARGLGYEIGQTDEDDPKLAVLPQRLAKRGLYVRICLQLVNWVTCFFIVAGVIHHWN
jgi:hypothetical protein